MNFQVFFLEIRVRFLLLLFQGGVTMTIRDLLRRALGMCPAAYRIHKLSLAWTSILLTGALLLMETALPLSPATYGAYRMAMELIQTASSILLIGVLGAVCIEERQL